jgi:outer membrane protein assembly factor BamE
MKKLILLMIMTVILTGCSLFRPHKRDVIQGNIITAEEVARLHTGMSEEAVREAMGDPVSVNIFAENRLNYVYTMQQGYDKMTIKKVICVFSNGRLVDIYQS